MPATGGSSARRSLVIGANGQDGSYLCELISERGGEIHGVAKQDHWRRDLPIPPRYSHHCADIAASDDWLPRVLRDIEPDDIYHVAAIHGSSGFSLEANFGEAVDVNLVSLHACLEYARLAKPHREVRIFYTSSIRALERRGQSTLSEESPRCNSDLYAITKNASQSLIELYARDHDVSATYGIMSNHDSPRRRLDYFLPKVAAGLAQALKKQDHKTAVNSLDFYFDVGHAREYMAIAIDHLKKAPRTPLLYASGRTWQAKELVSAAYSAFHLDWEAHVTTREAGGNERPIAMNNARMGQALGRTPVLHGLDVIMDILRTNYDIVP